MDVSKLKKSKNVWSQDAMLRDMTQFSMSKKDTEEVNALLSEAGKIFNKISGTTLRQLEKNKNLAQTIEQFNNTYVRKGEVVQNTTQHVNKLISWITARYRTEISKR